MQLVSFEPFIETQLVPAGQRPDRIAHIHLQVPHSRMRELLRPVHVLRAPSDPLPRCERNQRFRARGVYRQGDRASGEERGPLPCVPAETGAR